MDHSPKPKDLMSLSEVSRKLDIPWSRAFKLFSAGTLQPDYSTPHSHFFKAERLPELRAAVKSAATR